MKYEQNILYFITYITSSDSDITKLNISTVCFCLNKRALVFNLDRSSRFYLTRIVHLAPIKRTSDNIIYIAFGRVMISLSSDMTSNHIELAKAFSLFLGAKKKSHMVFLYNLKLHKNEITKLEN